MEVQMKTPTRIAPLGARILPLGVLLLSGALLGGCTANPSVWWPMEEGNEWELEGDYDGDTVTLEMEVTEGESPWEIEGVLEAGHKTRFTLSGTTTGGVHFVEEATLDDGGDESEISFDDDVPILPDRLAEGEEVDEEVDYEVRVNGELEEESSEDFQVEVKSTGDDESVEAGDYDNVVWLEFSVDGEEFASLALAKGEGPIAAEIIDESKIELELQ
jgi:hypothetical protein